MFLSATSNKGGKRFEQNTVFPSLASDGIRNVHDVPKCHLLRKRLSQAVLGLRRHRIQARTLGEVVPILTVE